MGGQLLGVGQHRRALVRQAGGAPVFLDGGQKVVVLEESAQTAPVVGRSVVTVVVATDHQGHKFTFDLP